MREATVAYVRQSTKQQQSIPWQITWAKETCQTKGWQYSGEYPEEGGHSDDLSLKGRPSLRQLLEDAKAKKFDRVLVWDRTRLARGRHLEMLIDYLGQCNVKVYMGDIADAAGGDSAELLIGFLQSVDRYFLRSLRKNTKRGLKDARNKGIHIGRVPAGFRLIDDGRSMVEEPWARDEGAMTARGMSPSQVRRVRRNLALMDSGNFAAFMAAQYEGSSRRYAEAKARRDQEAHDFEVWLVSMRPAESERASL